MKKLYLFMFLIFAVLNVNSQITETFESSTPNVSNFTSDGKTFNLTSQVGFQVGSPTNNFGYSQSARFIHVADPLAEGSYGQTGTISAVGGTFKINSFWFYVSGNAEVHPGVTRDGSSGSITFRGKLGGNTVFTVVRHTTGTNTGKALPGNGFTSVYFVNEGGSDNTNQVIDQLEIQLSSNYNYFAIDNFAFANEPSIPTVTTITPLTNFGAVTASLAGSNTDGGDVILNRGVLWSLTPNPVINGPSVTNVSASIGTGVFAVSVNSLPTETTIYYRAYATNSAGTTYGNTESFMTNPALSATQSQTNACNSINNAIATVTPFGGKYPYTFLWSNGASTSTALNLTPTNYSVLITDSEGTSISRIFSITQNTAISGTTSITNVSCNGGNNGAIDLTPTGGSGSYTYNWGGGITTEDRTGLATGNYSVTITDSNNCSVVISNIAIGQPLAALGGTTVVTNVACNGDNTGAINLTPTGGTGPYTLLWNDLVTTTEDRTGLTSGTYSVTITDINDCTAIISNITVDQPAAALTVGASSQTNILCHGYTTGSATVSATGGTPGYTYSWSPTGGNAATARGLAAGTYTVTVTDANFCQKTQSFTITQPAAALTATASSQTNILCNGYATGSATVSATGGTPGYSYSWNTTPVQTTATASGLSAGTYTVTVTDANSCTATREFTISQPPILSITPSQNNVSCNRGANGRATATVSGGTGAYTYSWSPTGGTAATATGLQSGTYTVKVTDANNCQITQSYTITQPAELTATQSQTEVLCNGSATGTATVSVSGGSGNYSYSWSPSGGNAATATGLTANTYTCTIIDGNACAITKSFSITQPTVPLTATTSQINATCSTGGQAAVSPDGGALGYSYLWSPGGETASIITGKAAGNYSCIITDANGCSITKSFTIGTTNTLIASTAQTNALCNGSSTGSASVIASGAPGPFTYVWAPSGGNLDTAVNLSAGNYSVTITSANGCSIVKNFTITEPTSVNINPSQTNVTCNGGSNGSASVTVTGGTGAYTYAWSPSGGNAATATGLSPNTYTVTVTDANLCIKTQSFTITEPDALTPSVSQTIVSCNGGSNGSATINVTGGTGAYSYQWSPSGGTNATASGLSARTYTVTVKDANLCETTATVVIGEPVLLTATIAKTDVLCNQANNGTATVTPSGGTGTYTYSWAPSGGTAATATGLSPNTYSVTVTDANRCTVTQTVQITEPTTLSATDTQTNVSCNGGNNGSASVVASGGTGNYSYLWAPSGGTAATAAGLTAGTYTVTVTDENSCAVVNTIVITEPDALTLTATPTAVSCHDGNNGSATVNVTGGAGSYSYSWSPSGGTAATATGLTAGTYAVTVTDDNSCTASLTVEILQPVNPVTLNTAVISQITVNGASLSGTASSNGINTDSGSCLTEVGFVYAQHSNPTVADSKINVTASLGTYTSTLSGLRGNRTYYVRTYAVNSTGLVNYGSEANFTTEKYTLTIHADSGHTKIYGTNDPVFNYTALGFVNGDTSSIITGLLSRDAGENVGKYNIKLGNINAGADYTIIFTAAEFEITKADQIISWNQTLEFGCLDSNNITLTATSNSGLPIFYILANTTLGTISEANLSISGSGSTTIIAEQSGDQNHNAAIAVIKPVEISQSGIVIQQWADVLFFDNKLNNFVAWQWYKNGTAVSGATRQYYNENQPLNGSYYVIAKDKNGSSIKSCPIETTGVAFTKKLKIYPNPVKSGDEFTLECDFSESQLSGSEVIIYDITGKTILTISNVKAKNQIIAPLQTAIYVMILKLADGQIQTINLLVK